MGALLKDTLKDFALKHQLGLVLNWKDNGIFDAILVHANLSRVMPIWIFTLLWHHELTIYNLWATQRERSGDETNCLVVSSSRVILVMARPHTTKNRFYFCFVRLLRFSDASLRFNRLDSSRLYGDTKFYGLRIWSAWECGRDNVILIRKLEFLLSSCWFIDRGEFRMIFSNRNQLIRAIRFTATMLRWLNHKTLDKEYELAFLWLVVGQRY